MSRDKQIEEMAKIMLEASTSANVEPVLEMEGKEVVLGENATKILDNILEQAFIPFLAEKLTDKGYRKADEVALEAVDDFQSTIRYIFLNMCDGNDYNTLNLLQIDSAIEALFDNKIAELKKKYTQEK
jgi:hypothetical protein